MRYIYFSSEKIIDNIDEVLCRLASILLLGMMFVIVIDVFMRYLFNAPLIWSFEVISAYLMPGLFFLSVSHALKANSHISVDILLNYFSEKTRYVMAGVSHLLAAAPLVLATIFMSQQTYDQFVSQEYFSSGLELPVWTTTILAPIGFGLLTLRSILKGFGYIGSIWASDPLTDLPLISGTEEHHE